MLSELVNGQKGLTLTATIDQVYPCNAYQGTKTVQNLWISDSSGKIKLTLWDKPEIPKEDTGGQISVRKGYVTENTWKGNTTLNLNAGQYSYVEVGKPEIELNEMMEAVEPEKTAFLQGEGVTGELEKANILGIMDEIIRHLKDRRAEIAEM